MQFLMKMPPIIRLTGAGCYQCPVVPSAMVRDLPGDPDGVHCPLLTTGGDAPDWASYLGTFTIIVSTLKVKMLAYNFRELIYQGKYCA